MTGVTSLSLASVNRALQTVDPDVRRGLTAELGEIGLIVSRDAQTLALSTIRRNTLSWSRMRVGQTPRLIYVVPRNKGVRGKGPRRRPNFAPLMLNRAMRPALAKNKPQVDRRFASVVSAVCSRFNGGRRG